MMLKSKHGHSHYMKVMFSFLFWERANIFHIHISICNLVVFKFYSTSCTQILPLHPIWCKIFPYVKANVEFTIVSIRQSLYSFHCLHWRHLPYISLLYRTCFGMQMSFKWTKYPHHLSWYFLIMDLILIISAGSSTVTSGTLDCHEIIC